MTRKFSLLSEVFLNNGKVKIIQKFVKNGRNVLDVFITLTLN